MLAPGDYSIAGSIELNSGDSNLEIDGGGNARLFGGKVIKAWSAVKDSEILARLTPEARGKVVVADLKQAGLDVGELRPRGFHDSSPASALELFFNARPMTLARWPNKGGWAETGAPNGPKSFSCTGERPKRWKTPNDPWIFGHLRFD